MSAAAGFQFSAAEFEQVFPFHVAIDTASRITGVGRSMRKLCPGFAAGTPISELFQAERSATVLEFSQLSAAVGRLWLLRLRPNSALLRGQWQHAGSGLVFLGSPWLGSTEEAHQLGLVLKDFAALDPTHELLQLVQIQQIVTEDLKKFATGISTQAQQLEEAARMKDSFLASMSHELRTPLTSIIGLSDSLLDPRNGEMSQRQLDYARMINVSGLDLLALINDILDLAKLGSGQHELDRRIWSVEELCVLAMRRVRPAVEKRRQRLEYSNEVPGARLFVDPIRTTQVLQKLLDNASKFTPVDGELGLRVRAVGTELHFVVWDRGIGIAPDQLTQIFQPFVQVDERLGRKFQGTGVGLALVDKLVALHGGRVEVKSERERGSEFTVILPAGALQWAQPPAEPDFSGAGAN